MGTKQIKDPIHGYVPVRDDFIEHLVDHPFFQRLRYIRQLTATYMVYPSANHTRFEHSIGVYHLAGTAFETLRGDGVFRDLDDNAVDEIRDTVLAAALLHDVGHPPLSHLGEELLHRTDLLEILTRHNFVEKLAPITSFGQDPLQQAGAHELMTCAIILEEFADGLDTMGIQPKEVCAYVLGLSIIGETEDVWQRKVASDLISSNFDVDRLDYIARDDHMTGAEVANVDTDRMVRAYTTAGKSLVLSEKALSVIRNYLEGRLSLYNWVTQHHKVVYAGELLKRSVTSLQENWSNDIISVEKILEEAVADPYVLEQLRAHTRDHPQSHSAELFTRFQRREFLHSCWKHRLDYINTLQSRSLAKEFDKAVDNNAEKVEEWLNDSLPDCGDIWVVNSNVPQYDTAGLRKIYIKQRDSKLEKQSVEDLDLYVHPKFLQRTPYVFCEKTDRADVVQHLIDGLH